MAHFAKLDLNNIVTEVIVVANENALNEAAGIEFIKSLGLDGIWKQTSYNTLAGEHREGGTPFRKNFAGIGDIYDEIRDAFFMPKPQEGDWEFDENTCTWLSKVIDL
jgi:hypothetical protein